jgi:CrcB protein
MTSYLLVALGGGAGAVARYALGVQTARLPGGWPWGTFIANVSGGVLMGVLAGWLAERGGADAERWRLLLGVGVLGGFTTFSAFSLETALMLERGAFPLAVGYAAGSVLLSVAAVFAGLLLPRQVFS